MGETIIVRVDTGRDLTIAFDCTFYNGVPCQHCNIEFGFKTNSMSELNNSFSIECPFCGKGNVFTVHFPKEILFKATMDKDE